MRLLRNASFLLLVVVVMVVGGGRRANAFGYCDTSGAPTYVGGIEGSGVSCGTVDNMCDAFENGSLCRDFCGYVCNTTVSVAFLSCTPFDEGNGDCSFTARCKCANSVE